MAFLIFVLSSLPAPWLWEPPEEPRFTLTWEAPTQREDNTPLDASEISHYGLIIEGVRLKRRKLYGNQHAWLTYPGCVQLVTVLFNGQESDPTEKVCQPEDK